jgi:hypothetical protein
MNDAIMINYQRRTHGFGWVAGECNENDGSILNWGRGLGRIGLN